MPGLLDRETRRSTTATLVTQRATSVEGVDADERHARAELRRQIGRLELELAGLVAEGLGRVDVPHRVGALGTPRVLGLGELEELRDALVLRVAEAGRALERRAAVETANRELLAAMIAAPAEFRWLRISRADVGELGCGHWHSRPVLGPLGMLMGWWRVKVSSGCPRDGRLTAASGTPTKGPRRRGEKPRSPSWRSSPGSSA